VAGAGYGVDHFGLASSYELRAASDGYRTVEGRLGQCSDCVGVYSA